MANHRAHPTTYGGVNFRSRHEAKYAAFFDEIGWRWEYEPFDLYGWVPDFVIYGDRNLLIEIKPYASVRTLIRNCIGKLEIAEPDEPVLLMGASPAIAAVYDHGNGDSIIKGKVTWIRTMHGVTIHRDFHNGRNVTSPFCITSNIEDAQDYIEYLFRVAGNSVQWRAK